ncbi:unnamed protein product [Aphanomyces euteiches]
MDAQRALLDELMGRNRDGDKPEEDIRDFRDSRICKRYLCGLCPNDLFQNTKMDMGECSKLHMPKLKLAYEEEKKRTNRDYGYENELLRELERYVSDVEKKIARAQKRLEEEDGSRAPSLVDVESNKEVLQITAEIADMVQKAEDAGNEGEVDLSMELMAQVETLKQKKAQLQSTLSGGNYVEPVINDYDPRQLHLMNLLPGNPMAMTNVNQKLRVCDMCGAFLSIFDSDRRLADHFGGKMHLGYMQIRKKIAEMKKAKEDAAAAATVANASNQDTSSGDANTSNPQSQENAVVDDPIVVVVIAAVIAVETAIVVVVAEAAVEVEAVIDVVVEVINTFINFSRVMNQDDCVHVCVRIRPTSKKEKLDAIASNNCVRVPPTATGSPPTQLVVGKDRPFTFDIIHTVETSQESIYKMSVTALIQGFMEGYNATVLAYGQTGTGKTYTMTGGASYSANIQESHGVIPRAVCHVFRLMQERNQQLSIREDADGNIVVAGAKSQAVQRPEDVMRLLSMGSASRVTGSTNMNEQSSRSHAIFTLILQQKNRLTGEFTHAKFHLVDLAGSERAKRTGAVGGRFKESVNINQGLLALGNVISALGDENKKKTHVPYRDSKLTRLLQDSLGGNSKTLMIACVSPVAANFEETLNTLKYANRAKNIKNRPVVNHVKEAETDEQIQRMKHEIQMLQSQLVVKPQTPSEDQQQIIDDLMAKQKVLRRVLHTAKGTAKESATALVALERDIKALGRPVQQRLNDVVKQLNSIVLLPANDGPEGPETTENSPSEEETSLRSQIQKLEEKLKQDVEIFDLKSKELEQYHQHLAQAQAEVESLRAVNSKLTESLSRTRSERPEEDVVEEKTVRTSLFRQRKPRELEEDDQALIAETEVLPETLSVVTSLQQEILQLKMELKKQSSQEILVTSKEEQKPIESNIPKLRAQTAQPTQQRSALKLPQPPKTADPSAVPLNKTSIHAMFQTQLLAAVENHMKHAQVANILHEKETTAKQKEDMARRKHGLEMEKLRQSLSVQSSITDLSQSIQAMNKKMHAASPDQEELIRLKRRKDRAEKKLSLLMQKIDNQSYVEPAVQEELTALEEQIEDLTSQILFQDAQLETVQALIPEVLSVDHLLKHVGGEFADPKLKSWIEMCWTELVHASVESKSMQSVLQHQEELVAQLTHNREQLENGLNAARAEYDRRLMQYEIIHVNDKKQMEEFTILLADKQNQMDDLRKQKDAGDMKTIADLNHLVSDRQNELNQLKRRLVEAEKDKKRLVEYDRYMLERQYEWEAKLTELQNVLVVERQAAQATIDDLTRQLAAKPESSNQDEVAALKESLKSQQEYVVNLEKHVVLFKNKAKQTQLQLQQLIRDSSCNQSSDRSDENQRIKQLEEANDALMKENAAMKVHVRALKGAEPSEPHVRIRIPKTELKEVEQPNRGDH